VKLWFNPLLAKHVNAEITTAAIYQAAG